jgi:hypothetical protein
MSQISFTPKFIEQLLTPLLRSGKKLGLVENILGEFKLVEDVFNVTVPISLSNFYTKNY